MKLITCLPVLLLGAVASAPALLVDFESVVLGPEDFGNGSDLPGSGAGDVLLREVDGVSFPNSFTQTPDFSFWSGWSVSATTDTTTPGFLNQYSAFPGGGVNAAGEVVPGSQYGVAFGSTFLELPAGVSAPQSVYVANTTYAVLDMLSGSSFSQPFGGVDGERPDFFQLLITGRDPFGFVTGFIPVTLADFRGEDDFIIEDWILVDLTPLGTDVRTIEFGLNISDPGTPSYFALDNLAVVPEPSTLVLLGLCGMALAAVGLRRRR